MCKIVIVGEYDAECHTHGDLVDVLGGDPVYFDHGLELADDDCLCDVDMPATAAKFGYAIASDPCDMFVTFSAIKH